MQTNLTIFASGTGSNAQKIIEYFKAHPSISVGLIVCNNPAAGVLDIARDNNIDTLIIERNRFFQGDAYLPELKDTDIIILAGFLWKIPGGLIRAFPDKIINIHPALLPKYGGKGMYGSNVHKAVLENQEKESGITIHLVDEEYDHGRHLFQAKCAVNREDCADRLAQRIHLLEHKHFAKVIEDYVKELQATSLQ